MPNQLLSDLAMQQFTDELHKPIFRKIEKKSNHLLMSVEMQ